MALTVGVDIGGTKVAAGVVDENGRILAYLKRETPSADPAATEDTIAAVVQELAAAHPVEAVGLGAAGFIDEQRSTVLFAPNLAWRDEPLRADVQRRVDLPVIVENDANAAAWAEYRFGAGRGQHEMVCVTVGTGIGGGLVLGGQLYRGRFGIAGEFGHMRVVPDGRPCGCGNRGCWEQYASGNALLREAREAAMSAPLAARLLLGLGDGTPEGIRGPAVTAAARRGDPMALGAFREVGRWLGQGLADLAAVLDPGCFVIGGGVSEARDVLFEPVRAAFAAALSGGGHRPLAEIRLAQLANDAGLVGAADLARTR